MPKTSRRKMRLTLISQSEAARIIGCHRNTVLARYSRDEIRGEIVGGLLYLEREDVERVAKLRMPHQQGSQDSAA